MISVLNPTQFAQNPTPKPAHTLLVADTIEGLFRAELMPCGFLLTGPWRREGGTTVPRLEYQNPNPGGGLEGGW